jgi:hypothetical protein
VGGQDIMNRKKRSSNVYSFLDPHLEMHAHETHAYEIHALEMHARKVLGEIFRSPTLQTVGAVVDLSRSELQNTRVFALVCRVKTSAWPDVPI